MGKGFGGMPGNMKAIMQQAQQMQQQLLGAREKAEMLEAEGSSGGGAVVALVNGKREIVSLKIQAEALSPDNVEIVQDMVIAACNDALRKVGEAVDSELAKVTGGMKIPGM